MGFKDKIAHYGWELAYGSTPADIASGKNILKEMHEIKNPYRSKWFADPFILDVTDNEIELLVEEFDDCVKRGRIAKIRIDRQTDTITDCKIVLDLKTHLSFPVIYRIDGNIYVHPENSASGSSYIYKYDKATEMLVEAELMLDEPVTDAIIKKINNEYYMFATKLPEPNGNIMHIYKSDSFVGGYKEVYSIQYKDYHARMGGDFIINNGKNYRIAQDCNGAYGKGLIIESFELKTEEFSGKTVKEIYMPFFSKYEGIHTYNTYGDYYIVDLKKYDYPLIHKFVTCIKRIIKR